MAFFSRSLEETTKVFVVNHFCYLVDSSWIEAEFHFGAYSWDFIDLLIEIDAQNVNSELICSSVEHSDAVPFAGQPSVSCAELLETVSPAQSGLSPLSRRWL